MVLIVEDHETTVRFLTEQLEQSGIEVVTAATATEAITSFLDNQERIDLIILDGKLGPTPTDDYLNLVRKEGIFEGIILAASANEEHSEALVKAGADESVDKLDAGKRAIELLGLVAKDQETLRRLVDHLHQEGPNFELISFLLTGEDPGAKATAFLDDLSFVFFTQKGTKEAYREFKKNGFGLPEMDQAILGSS